jgi:hypothetical protein
MMASYGPGAASGRLVSSREAVLAIRAWLRWSHQSRAEEGVGIRAASGATQLIMLFLAALAPP